MSCYSFYNRRKYYGYDYYGCCGCDEDQIKDTICDCCVKPMENVLKQLKGENNVIILTTSGTEGIKGKIICVKDSIVTMDVTSGSNQGIYTIPICQITEVIHPMVQSLYLFKPCGCQRTGECRCCECSLRKKLEKFKKMATNVKFLVVGLPAGDFSGDATIVKVGEGIVVFKIRENYFAVSICKITELLKVNNG